VEGSIRRLGTTWRITARVVRPEDETQVWSESFDRDPKQLVSLAPEIATKLSTALVGQLGQGTRAAVAERPTTNSEAYEAYLRGNFLVAERTRDKLQQALTEYRRALDLDPSFAAARARIGFVLSLMADFGWIPAGETTSGIIARGLAMVDTALQQDSSRADSWFARCSLLWEEFGLAGGNQLNRARAACERAVALAPRNAEIRNRLGFVLLEFSDLEGATRQARLAQEIDPQWQLPHWLLSSIAWQAGDLSIVKAELDSVERLAPASIMATLAPALRGRLQFMRGDTAGLRESILLARARKGDEHATALEGLLWAKRGRRDSAAAIATRLDRGPHQTYFNDIYAALIWMALSDTTRALDVLGHRPPRVAGLVNPDFAGLRGHPRYEAMLAAGRRRLSVDGPETR
jgi:tetratricopeptide (TPR) repeat protein